MPARTKTAEPVVVEESVLPPGQRDRSGFWFPLGYDDPQMLVRRSNRRTRARHLVEDEPEETQPS